MVNGLRARDRTDASDAQLRRLSLRTATVETDRDSPEANEPQQPGGQADETADPDGFIWRSQR